MKITVVTPVAPDKWGNPSATAATTREVTVIGVAPTEQGSRKSTSDVEDRNREGSIETATVYLRSQDSGIAHTDEVLLPGDDRPWKVDSVPQSWAHPMASAHGGSVIVLTRRIG